MIIRFYTMILVCTLAACTPRIHYLGTETKTYKTEEIAADERVKDMVTPYKTRLDKAMNQVIGNLAKELPKAKPESPLGNFVADLIHKKSEDYYEKPIDFTVVNYGGLRIPALPEGEIIKGKIFELMPFDNMLVVMEIDANTLRQLFETMASNGGWPISKHIQYTIEDARATNILINGESIDEDKIYKIALSDYLANGGDKLFFLKDKKRHNLGVLFRDAIIEYITEQKGKPMDVTVEGRVTIR